MLWCTGFSLQWLLLLWSTGCICVGSVVVARGLKSAGSVVVAHGLSCSVTCGIFLEQESNPCPLHWQADSFFFFFFFNLFLAVLGLHFCARAFPSVASGGHSSSRCVGLSLSRPLLLWSTGSRRAGSVVVAHGPSYSMACGIFPDQGSNLCPLH